MQYLKFPDAQTAQKTTGWWTGTAWLPPTPQLQFAVRGTLYNDDAEYSETGEITREPSVKDGFFIDVIYGQIPGAAQAYIITPDHPDFVLA